MKKKVTPVKASLLPLGILMLVLLFVLGCSDPVAGTPPTGDDDRQKYSDVPEPDGVLARWDFKNNDASRTGSLADKNLVFLDKSGNGNDLELRVYDASLKGTAIENLSFSAESMTGKSGGSMKFESSQSAPTATLKNFVLGDFITVEDAPINEDAFEDGYTFELLYKLPLEFTNADRWMGLMRRELTYQGNYNASLVSSTGYEIEGGTTKINISNCKEVQFSTLTKGSTHAVRPDIWSLSMDTGGQWYHIAVVCDNNEVRMYLNGALGFRNHTLPVNGSGIGLFVDNSSARFIVGSSQSNNSNSNPIATVDPADIIRRTLHGNLETVRISNKALDKEDWLIADFAPHTAKLGNNKSYTLQGPSNGANSYVFGFIPDTQNTVKWCSPETTANTTATWTGTGVMDNAFNYLIANHTTMKLQSLMHLGDVVEDQASEWQYKAFEAPLIKLVDAGIKIQMGHGNHDQTGANGFYARYFRNSASNYAKAVSKTSATAIGGGYVTFGADSSALLNSYMTVTAGSYTYLFINMQYSANAYSNDHQNWLKGVLDANPGIPTVIFCHNLFDVSDAKPNEITLNNAGNSVWNIAKTYNQVFLMAAGHNHGSGWIKEKNNANNDVFMMMVDYQFGYNGGNTYLRLLEFNETANKIYITTFSPAAAYLTGAAKSIHDFNYMTGAGNEGSWDINFASRFSF